MEFNSKPIQNLDQITTVNDQAKIALANNLLLDKTEHITIQQLLAMSSHTGLVVEPTRIINAGDATKFDITTEGVGVVINKNISDSSSATANRVVIPVTVGITDPHVLTTALSHIFVDSLGVLTVEIDPPTVSDIFNRLYLGALLHGGGVIIAIIPNPIMSYGSSATEIVDLVLGGGKTFQRTELTANVAANLTMNIPASCFAQYGRGNSISFDRPNIIETIDQTPIPIGNFFKAFNDGTNLIINAANNFLDPVNFNDAGVLTSVSPNKFTRIVVFQAGLSNDVVFYYGTKEFSSAIEALSGPEPTFVEHPDTFDISVVSKIGIKQNVTNLVAGLLAGDVIIETIISRTQL